MRDCPLLRDQVAFQEEWHPLDTPLERPLLVSKEGGLSLKRKYHIVCNSTVAYQYHTVVIVSERRI